MAESVLIEWVEVGNQVAHDSEFLIWHGVVPEQPVLASAGQDVRRDERILVHSLSGFLDAGRAADIASASLLAGTGRLVATINPDAVFDYRARRPTMTYIVDHFAAIDLPQIAVHELTDDSGRIFYLLTGPEPDYHWQKFADAVIEIIERLGITMTVGLAGVPWPTPHTRPLGVTLHGTERDLLDDEPAVLGTIEVPGHMSGVIELRLGEVGRAAMGVSAHVPHYLAQVEYPRAAMSLLQALTRITGLEISAEELRVRAERAEAEVADQVGQSEEFASVLAALELQHDQMSAMRAAAAVSARDFMPEGDIPSGDEIAAQVEQFLARMDDQES